MEMFLAALFIFALRVVDQSLGVLKMVLLVRGRKRWGLVLGVLESAVWVIAIRQVFLDLDEPLKLAAFAIGFGVGGALGAKIEEWLAMGQQLVRVLAPINTPLVAPALREAGFSVTVLNGEGLHGDVRLSFSVVQRRRVREALEIIHGINPEALVTLEHTSVPEVKPRSRASA